MYSNIVIGILRGFDQFGTIPTENDSYEILIKTSSRIVLASILWKIAFNADRMACLQIGETFKVNFTEKGLCYAQFFSTVVSFLTTNKKKINDLININIFIQVKLWPTSAIFLKN